MVSVDHGHPPGRGKMMMVAVTVGAANALVYLYARFDPAMELLSRQTALGNLTLREYQQYNLLLMQASQNTAEVVGERLAGLPARVVVDRGALVAAVLNGPASGKLQPGDVIVRIGPYPVTAGADVRSIMHRFQVGDVVTFTVIRHGQTIEIPIRTQHMAGDPNPAVGIYIAPKLHYLIPRKVTIRSQNIGGPSAGMMFSLEIYDQLTGRNLARGRMVAGTGEILPDGAVGPIGGVGQKVITVERAGARIFLCPVANYAKALAMKREMGYRNLTIYSVANIHQALADLTK
jgi:PDZ domain-containing protein